MALSTIAGFAVLIAIGYLLVGAVKAPMREMFGILDPSCVTKSNADLEKLVASVADRLPSRRIGLIDAYSGCDPPEVGAWIQVKLSGASIDDSLNPFRSEGWSTLSGREISEVAYPGETGSAVTGFIDGRPVNVYALASERAKGLVRVVAWFDDEDAHGAQ
ncbi:hypothetical protein [Microtetraspora niveoalba]|uniref:hypothetical protein n=1 Tax=Microtetraspora niveoalba TaxID=46175 RepID=UPI0012F78AC3|nr:hypothetical protein [Microtetraspora niveoalba]